MAHNLRPVKQEDSTKASEINVKVLSQLNEVDQFFRVKRDEPLRQLMMRWSVRADVKDYRMYRFILDGKRIKENQTANEVGLADGDCIDVFTEQIGG